MEYVILAFLMIRPLSQYDLLQAFSRDVSPFYKASLGSIQTRLLKLKKNDSIVCAIDEASNRKKKIYTITEKGKLEFFNWMESPDIENNFEAYIINRIFFFGLIDLDKRLKVVENLIDYLETEIIKYEQELIKNANNDFPDNFSQIAKYQLKTLDLGISNHRSTLLWCEELLIELKAERNK